MNDYGTARLRFEKISRSHEQIKRQAQAMIGWASGEWDDAADDLCQSNPGRASRCRSSAGT